MRPLPDHPTTLTFYEGEVLEAHRPKVLIVGAGLGGLTLAILLEKAGMDYEIYERAKAVVPLGAALFVGPTMIPIFKQIGIYEQFLAHAKQGRVHTSWNEHREMECALDFELGWEMGGAMGYFIARPVLYNILLALIPKDRFHMSKRVLSMTQSEYGVLIRTSDNKTHEGDILVGADGAYSGVRQSLYDFLKREGRLPASDGEPLPFHSVCLVGQTKPLDDEVELFPEIKDELCHYNIVAGIERPYRLSTFTTYNNTMCWSVVHYLDKVSSKLNDSFRNSEWGPEAAEAMSKEVRDFPIPGGNGQLTVGDMIDRTPQHLISKVMLEEKLFSTWYHDRTVLLGDAVHKMNPAGGQGAMTAMHDAICLANWLNTIATNDEREIGRAFKEYKAERLPAAEKAFAASQTFNRFTQKTIAGALARYVRKHMPLFLWKIALKKLFANRPQVSFLPPAEDLGTVPPAPQPSLEKTRLILAQRAYEAKKDAVAI